MSSYLCTDCNQWHDSDWLTESPRGLCPTCEAKREEAMRDFVAREVGRVLREAENREQSI